MATDINLSSCQWIEPDQIRNYSDNKAIIKWALQFMTIDGNWIVLRPFLCSKNELKTLSDSVAVIPQLRYDFQSATIIFYHLSKFHRFSSEQTTELDAAIKAKSESMAWSRP